ncbi:MULTISPECIES: asparagine synthase (glutamine-hydrolyzing) [Clostridium]|uniref:asparagine synthase (glutamine-hydrolyzing) n=1 Tax=Clostridium cibarium TaxID=2762247 RepID=A0ABR8PRN5_9CLOT|nr:MULTISPECIES: asparagine synthase (glutamine-hydrolyzing) [Clostridium]MBD7910836.1 asparagine synthase (glutamine-hydrolyzing) [Clostridium cibarium]
MCGFISVFKKNHSSKIDENKIRRCLDNIVHRGPDDEGIYNDEEAILGFRRLSIIDLANGHQPFEKDSYEIVFNGEIYNYKSIKENLELKGYDFKTNSDTEVLLTNYIEKKEKSIYDLRGMFTFIIYNKNTKEVFGARDQFGIKPLYYIDNEDFVAFASEYKALMPLIKELKVDEKSLQEYLSFQYVPGDRTMIEGIKKIPPAHYFKIEDNKLVFKKYHTIDFNEQDISKEDVYKVMEDSVNSHLISDVEVGTFLSGGVDSSIIAALVKKTNPKVKSFTVGFDVPGYDEIDIAKKTSEILDIENIHINITEDDYIKAIKEVVYKFDDPVADPSAIGVYYLTKEASKHVKVVLSGEGSDELFGGYNIYKEYFSLKPIFMLPRIIQKFINYIAKKLPNKKGKNYLIRGTTPLRERYIGNAKIFDDEESKKVLVNYKDEYGFKNVVKGIFDESNIKGYNYVTTMQNVDINTWLEGDILAKGDKMAMANSIELRVPFLDREVLEVAEKIPLNKRVSKENTKLLLREAFEGIVPKHVVNRKKLGFPTPIRVWLNQRLGQIVKETIINAKVNNYIDKEYVLKLLEDHQNHKRDNSRKIWVIFIFCIWHQIYIEKNAEEFSLEEENINGFQEDDENGKVAL